MCVCGGVNDKYNLAMFSCKLNADGIHPLTQWHCVKGIVPTLTLVLHFYIL